MAKTATIKVPLSKLLPNPHRNIKRYPWNKEKLKALDRSINETGFWPNLICRKAQNGKYELAYGHHRLEALKRRGVRSIDIICLPLSDAAMLKMMANENMDYWGVKPAVVYETVRAAAQFLEIDIYSAPRGAEFGMGALSKRISKALGGNWNESITQEAVSYLRDEHKGIVDREAVESFDTAYQADEFRKAVKREKVPKKKQKSVAAKVRKSAGRRMSHDVKDIASRSKPKTKKSQNKEIQRPLLDDILDDATKYLALAYQCLRKLKEEPEWGIGKPEVRAGFLVEARAIMKLLPDSMDRAKGAKKGIKQVASKVKG